MAFDFRTGIGLTRVNSANAYRLVFSEGDLLPGLIIDYYNGVAVIQADSAGMRNLLPLLTEGLREIYGSELTAVYDKSSGRFLFGSGDTVEIMETGHRFRVDFIRGQKTGFFLDQRGNRMFAQYYAKDRKVLNAFCYSGAFSVYALKGGATAVHSIDSSRQAIAWTEENIRLNGCDESMHHAEVADVKQYLVSTPERYDLIILDPPAFAKTHQVSNNALHAYVHINAEAIRILNPGGKLFTFSCSQPVSREMFRSAIQSAAIETGRRVRILHQLSQGPDHPVSIFHPEGEYLKGLILEVD
jgi:23S rRNA (cytosine1962-C5)-methyltransferase